MRITILFLFIAQYLAGQTYTINGYIEDSVSGETLISANIYDEETLEGTVSNTFGFFSITLPAGKKNLVGSYIGFENGIIAIDLQSDTTINIKLSPYIELQTIEIIAKEQINIAEETAMSTTEIPVEQIKKIPALLGEVDVLKALQLLPGVQSGGEGQSGLYVRGGSPDQNLILLDGVPVYNVSHLFGFFSVFNADAIKDVSLIKGGYPARYGGRLSSVLNITMKDGNLNEFHGSGSIGLVASKLTLEGPINKGKTSFLLSGRRTYIDLIARPLIKKSFESEGVEGTTGYYFYDVNLKLNHVFSQKDKLFFSLYTGDDKFSIKTKDISGSTREFTDSGIAWGNLISALRWNHLWTPKLFSNTTLTFSRYQLDTKAFFGTEYVNAGTEEEIRLNYISGITDLTAKIDFDYLPNPNHFIRFGASTIFHKFRPGTFDLYQSGENQEIPFEETIGQDTIGAYEFDMYVEDDVKLSDQLKINAGVHLSGFHVKKKFYGSVQPRLSARYLISKDQSLKLSFATMRQYINLLAFEGIGLPTDLWVPTTDILGPQDSWQVAGGYAFKLSKNLDMTVEGYYKRMFNLLSYKEGSGLFELTDWEDRVTQGDGESYGFEFFLQKKTGKLSGWIGYTLSWTNRQFEELNFGQKYPYRFDRRHDVSVVAQYQISPRVNISGAWVYGTGNAVTLGNSEYRSHFDYEGGYTSQQDVTYYTDKNNFRMQAFHRFDIGINFVKKKKRFTRTWSIGAYNTYNRKNPFYVYVSNNYDTYPATKTLRQQSLFPVIPYFNYSFEF